MEDENTMVPETGIIDHTGPEWYQMEIPLDEIGRYIHTDLKTAARSVISIGYWLMYVRDRNQFQEYGYSNINEYAARQFGFSRSTTKRYIDRCIRFSKGGNSPILDDRYRDFSKAQLQEMLGLDDEQLEQVTPNMTVRQIRAMKQPKEIPYVELPGQISITDFPGIEPEAAPDVTDVPPEPERAAMQSCEISVEDLMPEVEPLPVESVATSQRENCPAHQLSAYGTPKREYPADSLIATEGCEGGHYCDSCSMECGIRQKDRWCVEAPCGNPCEYICGRAMRALDQGLEQPAVEMQQNEEICCENDSVDEVATLQPEEAAEPTDTELLREMLGKEKKYLEEMIKVDAVKGFPKKLLRKKKILVAALAGMLCDLDMPEPEEPEQPELPLMKNNDQRKAWLRDYKSWGLWYADEHIGARYYKYDFENGARLIAEVYDNHNHFTKTDYESSYLHLVGGPEPENHPTGAYGRWRRHETYSRYPDSETELMEFLKALQKGK